MSSRRNWEISSSQRLDSTKSYRRGEVELRFDVARCRHRRHLSHALAAGPRHRAPEEGVPARAGGKEAMMETILGGLSGLGSGALSLFSGPGLPNLVMLAVGGALLWLGVGKDVEPLLLVPIGFGCVLVNIPFGGLNEEGGLLKTLYEMGVANELFPLLIFIGIGAMIDFSPLLEKPSMLLFGAAGQVGIFLTLLLALALGFSELESVSIAIIGACDGPPAIYVTSQYAPHLLGAVSVAAYSYMALVPIIQPPIMRALTTQKERTVRMPTIKRSVSTRARLLFPIVVTPLALGPWLEARS